MYEFVVESGFVGSPRERGELEENLDAYGEDGYLAVQMNTVLMDGRPYTVVVMKRAVDDEPPQGAALRSIDGGKGSA